MVEINELESESVIKRTKLPGVDWGVNYYTGCGHKCVYYYLRFLCKWRSEEWGEFVDVRTNAPRLVKEESEDKKGTVLLCTGGDPYQPVEEEYELTKKVLENLNPDLKLSILTKSDLITRDVGLFKRFKNCELGLTITTFKEEVRRVFEAYAPSSSERLNALKRLKQEGLTTYAFIGPILPYLTDLEAIFEKVSPFVDYLMFEDLNLKSCKREVFQAVRENFPELLNNYENLSRKYWLRKERRIRELSQEYDKRVKVYFKHLGSLKF